MMPQNDWRQVIDRAVFILLRDRSVPGYRHLVRWLQDESRHLPRWLTYSGRTATGEWLPAVGYARTVLGMDTEEGGKAA